MSNENVSKRFLEDIPMPKKSQTKFSGCPCAGATLDKLIQPAILAILTQEPLHGYELTQRIGEIPHFLDELPDLSGIYRMLKSLETRGMVTSNWDLSSGGRPKRIFSITESGKQCLEHWNGTLKKHHEAIGSLLKATQKAIR
ncbi:MAG: PadR family transcriptional regulator [Planctomycetaceae bacterium]|jgi:DNA-binding PadR family transcriptional regulator|nr:PadR family transcriptional regulator [Planctomycetaceae bacterium]